MLESGGRKVRAVVAEPASSGSFDSAAHDVAVCGLAQDDSFGVVRAVYKDGI
jgi:hypothetical protein